MLLWARLRALLSGARETPALARASSPSRRSKPVRIALWLAAVVIGVEVLYLALANCFLNFGLLPRAFAGTNSVKGENSSGWTIFPGRLHVRNLKITIQDHNIQSLIQLARAEVVLSLHELPSMVFHATKVRGSGLVFRFRQRVMPESKDFPSVRAVPPIPGFEDPPVFEAWAPEPPIPDDKYNLWTVHLENVDVEADELWVQQFRYLGRARAVGAFRLKAKRALWVGPASLDIEPGRIVVAGRDALGKFGGRIECTVHPFDVRKPDGLAVFRYISAKMHLGGEVVAGDFVDVFLDPASHAHVEQRGAKLAIDTTLDHGVLAVSSRIALEGDSLHVQVGALLADLPGPWSVVAAVEPKSGGGRVAATVSRATLNRRGFQAAPTTVRDATAGATSTTLDAAVPWALRGADLTLGDFVAPDLRIFNDVRLGNVRFRGGASVAHGYVVYSSGTLSGEGVAELRRAIADVGDTKFRGSVWVDAKASAFDERRSTGAFDLSLRAGDLSASDVSGDADCPWGSIKTAEAKGHLTLLPHDRASGKLTGSIDGAKLNWGDFHLSGNGDIRATVEPTDAPGGAESHVAGLVRAFQVRMRSGAGAPQRWGAQIPQVLLDASLDWVGGRFDGPVEITANGVQAAIGEVSMRTDLHAQLRVKPIDVLEQSGTVSGVVDLTKASLWNRHGRAGRVEGWWAKIAVSPTRVVAREHLDLDGRVSARFRDGLPGLLALSEADQIPGFLPEVLPLHGLVGTVGVRRRCQLTDLTLSQFEGGPLVASGRIQNVPGDTRGAVLVRLAGLGVVSAGVSLGEHGDGVSLFAGDEWLKKQMAGLDREAASVAAEPCAPPPKSECD